MPTIVHAEMSMTSIHTLSWIAGQWYLCVPSTRREYTIESEVAVDAIVSGSCAGSWPRTRCEAGGRPPFETAARVPPGA